MSQSRKCTVLAYPKKPVQHCKDDLACLHCCKCGLKHQKECAIRNLHHQQAMTKLKAQIESLRALNLKLKAETLQLQKRQKEYENIDEVKDRIKQEMSQEIREEYLAEELIRKQKIVSLQQQVNQLRAIRQERDQYQQLYEESQLTVEQLQGQLQEIEQREAQYTDIIDKLQEDNAQLTARLAEFDQLLQDKSAVIDQLKTTLDHCEDNYKRERERGNNIQEQKMKTNLILRNKENEIEQVKKTNCAQKENLHLLQIQASELAHIITNLDREVESCKFTEANLKDKLCWTEEFAALKENQVHEIKRDVACLKQHL